ncbi:hypothetical protein DCAR_0416217 [Daucus carota subsp. sativus]|uniref:Uncharacterized protein n=1 Tax=Daucus carota subsp. sativus TaxID=79200 RepID=A0A165X9R1_DAUCS|nr:hypothetical protein DCAR_0416217 [Daucus carota subsp. sativus]
MQNANPIHKAEEFECVTPKSDRLVKCSTSVCPPAPKKLKQRNKFAVTALTERPHQVYVQVPKDLSSIFLLRTI